MVKQRGIALLLAAALLAAPADALSGAPRGEQTVCEQEVGHGVTRGEGLELLYDTLGAGETGGEQPFRDVPDSCAAAVGWAAARGAVQGVGGGLFAPGASLTAQELAVMLHRLAGAPAASGGAETADSRAAAWAAEAWRWCAQVGLPVGEGADRPLTAEAVSQVLERFTALPALAQLRADLAALTGSPRPIGSQGEQDAAAYLQRRFQELGYTVTLQPYTDDAERTGYNVIAVRPGAAADADILVLSAHHDSVPTAYGANDNASGAAALLALAETLRDVDTRLELRLISFTDEENGKNGSRYYTSTLTEDELDRMLGDIQLDMLGGLGTAGLRLCTMDGGENWLTRRLQAADSGLTLEAETASDHASFQLAEVPAVVVTQSGRGYLYHSAGDRADSLDLLAISRAAADVAQVVRDIAADDTGSLRAIARRQGDGYVYTQRRQSVLHFGVSLAESEGYVGAAGTLVGSYVDKGEFWEDTYDTYRYAMRWFGGEEPMNTYYCYRNGFLDSVEIRPGETGYASPQVSALLRETYGEPGDIATDDSGAVLSESWVDPIYSKYLFLDSASGNVTVLGFSNGRAALASYPVEEGEAVIGDERHAAVWDYLCGILPAEARTRIGEFTLFTDGYSGTLAYTSTITQADGTEDNTRFALYIDYYDVYDEDGGQRDWSRLTSTVLHEYGHVLLENETQIDLAAGEDLHDPAGFVEGSFRQTYYQRFWRYAEDAGHANYVDDPTRYVSQYASDYFHEDLAETFRVFVLGDKPQGDTVAAEKVLFFWEDARMTALRTQIREQLGLA